MSTIAVAVTAQPSNVPPRIKVDITDSGTPAITSVTVQRKAADGTLTPVRTLDGNPLTLVTSGSTRVGTVYDYEAPFGVAFTYTTSEYPAGVSSSVTLNVSAVWLVHPGIPGRSQVVTVQSLGDVQRETNRGVFRPMGRANPIVFTDGRRSGVEGVLSVLTRSDTDRKALNLLVDDAAVLLLNVPAGKGWGVDPAYLSVGNVTERRPSRMLVEADRVWELPYFVVDRPEGGSQAQWTLADVQATFASLNAVAAAYPTLNAVSAPPS